MLEHEQGNAWFDDVNTANISIDCRKGNASKNTFSEAALHFGHESFLWSELLKFTRALNNLSTCCHGDLSSEMPNAVWFAFELSAVQSASKPVRHS